MPLQLSVSSGRHCGLLVIRVDPHERRIGLSLKDVAASLMEEPSPSESRGRGKGRKRRGGDDFEDEEE